MPTQICPNCRTTHDVAVYVSGQRLLCRCGIHFEVRRSDVSVVRPASVLQRVEEPGATDRQRPAPVPDHTVKAAEGYEKTFISSTTKLDIPGYELEEVLGRGGMGEVWRAKQKSLGRTVAVKILPPKLADDAEFRTRFEKESTALAALSHPNIIQIIDRGIAGDHSYFVMEYVAGKSLRDRLNKGALAFAEALRVVAQIGRAMAYAHDQDIVHRDLKPENILLDERGHVKVADFGLAGMRRDQGSPALTATRVAMGTVNYMAPEQRRDAKSVDGRADIYSLGVILYELLTGDLPIGRFKLPSERVGADVRLDAIVARSLEPDREARYPRAQELLADLEVLLGSSPDALPPSNGYAAPVPTDRPPSRARKAMRTGLRSVRTGLAIVGALSVGGFGLQRWAAHRALADHPSHGHPGAGELPHNTNGPLRLDAPARTVAGTTLELSSSFEPGAELLYAYAGHWRIDRGELKASQAGNESGGMKLIPRAYLSDRYFSTDELTAEVDLQVMSLEEDFPKQEDAQHFGELALRLRDLQISVFAIPEGEMRLGWRYFTPDGVEQSGNSARDTAELIEDPMPVPDNGGPIRVKLVLRGRKSGTEVEAFANGQRFAKKYLPGLDGQVGKVALGCRNLHCTFDNLKVRGKAAPAPSAATAQVTSRDE